MKYQKAIWSLRQSILIDLCSIMVTLCSTCIHISTASVGAIQLLQSHMVRQVREVTQVNKKKPAGEKKVTQVSSPVLPRYSLELYQNKRGRRGWKEGTETGLLEQMLQLRYSLTKSRIRP